MNNYWDFALEKLKSNTPIVIMIVVNAKGSTPGRQGFKMIISNDNDQFGTIGGGLMEQNFIKLSKEILRTDKQGFQLKKQVHHKYAPEEEQSGLICSGEEWIAIGLLRPDKENIKILKGITEKSIPNNTLTVKSNGLYLQNEAFLVKEQKRYFFDLKSNSDWVFKENLLFKYKLYIFGSGHVGLAVSRVFSLLDFYTIVIDNRTHVQTIDSNQFSNEIIIDDYKNAGKYIEEGETTFIAIVTSSMPTDVEVLASIIHKNVRYIGLMGSKAKKKEIFSQLQQKGIQADLLNKIKCPIGINSIKTHSAQEIAISIATEIISMKNA